MTEPTTPPPPAEPAAETSEPLGGAGKAALEAERRARREAERQAREARERTAELEAAALRRDVAAEKGLTDAQAKFLAGASRDEMATRADELLAAFRSDDGDHARRRPRERLRLGAAPSAEPSEGLGQIADEIMGGL